MLGNLLDVHWNVTYTRNAKIRILSINGNEVLYKYYKKKGYKDLVFSARKSHVSIDTNTKEKICIV